MILQANLEIWYIEIGRPIYHQDALHKATYAFTTKAATCQLVRLTFERGQTNDLSDARKRPRQTTSEAFHEANRDRLQVGNVI